MKDKDGRPIKFTDAEEFMGGSDERITYKLILLEYIRKIANAAMCEFRGGFYTILQTKLGQREVYVEDTRERYCNAVMQLYNMLFMRFDDPMLNKAKKFVQKDQELRDEFIRKSSPNEEVILGDAFYEKTEDKILLETYKQKKLKLYMVLYRQLSVFLARTKYLDQSEGLVDYV